MTHNMMSKEIVLFRHEGHKLDTVSAFCKRLVHKSGFPAEVIASTDLEESVSGAKYILNYNRVGVMISRIRDEKLPPLWAW